MTDIGQEKPKPKTADISSVVDKTEGEEKKRLETECEEYLKDSDQTSFDGFSKFTQAMILLIGGKKGQENGVEFASSNPLQDEGAQTSIALEIKKPNITFENTVSGVKNKDGVTVVEIKAESPKQVQKLTAYSHSLSEGAPLYLMEINLPMPPEVDSYITGRKEPVSSGMASVIDRNSDPTEAKVFAQKVFDVWRQGQQAQPPTGLT